MDELRSWPHCPHLGLQQDRVVYCAFETPQHRCYRSDQARPIPADDQIGYCLAEQWSACPRNRGEEPAASTDANTQLRRVPLYASGLIVALLAGFLILTRGGDDSGTVGRDDASAPSKGAAETSAPATTPAVIPPPALSSITGSAQTGGGIAGSPGASPHISGTASAATPTPGASRIHVVSAGDTLSTIATRYGTSVDAIMRANKLTDRNYIFSGQRLIVP